MPAAAEFQYLVLQLVPSVERGERVNAGVVLYCRQLDFLAARTAVVPERVAAIAPEGFDVAEAAEALEALRAVATGAPEAGPLGRLPASERFGWLAAPASTGIQPSPVHTGLTDDPAATLDHLFRTLVLSRTQAGHVGELLVTALATLTSSGAVEVFRPETDDDHVDLVAGRKGGPPRLSLQVKTALRLNPAGFAHATSYLVDGRPRAGTGYFYVVLWVDGLNARTVWLVPAEDFNRLVYRSGDQLIFEAYPDRADRWTPYRMGPEALGGALLREIDRLG